MNFGSVRSNRVKLWGGGLIFETNCIFEYKPSPHFRLDVVYKMGGRINGTLRYIHSYVLGKPGKHDAHPKYSTKGYRQ